MISSSSSTVAPASPCDHPANGVSPSPSAPGARILERTSRHRFGRARFSPDGKWFAYDSNESGRTEVYARRFPPTSDEWQVSSNGGASPLWSGDGHELYYIGSQSLMAVPIGGGERLNPGTPRALFHVTNQLLASSLSTSGPIGSLICGVTPDGGKFLFRSTSEERTASINVVLNWQSELREAKK
jgi:eukaryotic-like serine/threonine-protein kinase